MTAPRYPLQPLADAAGLSMPALGKRLGLKGSTWQEARDLGVGQKAADRYAVRVGLHPAMVWLDWGQDVVEADRARKRERQAKWAREKYARDAAHRAVKQERMRAYWERYRAPLIEERRRYRAANHEKIQQQRRAYRDANRDVLNARRREAYRRQKAGAARAADQQIGSVAA